MVGDIVDIQPAQGLPPTTGRTERGESGPPVTSELEHWSISPDSFTTKWAGGAETQDLRAPSGRRTWLVVAGCHFWPDNWVSAQPSQPSRQERTDSVQSRSLSVSQLTMQPGLSEIKHFSPLSSTDIIRSQGQSEALVLSTIITNVSNPNTPQKSSRRRAHPTV